MAELKVEHHGFSINFSENEDLWRCYALGFEHKSLLKLKQKINKWLRERLDKANIVVAFKDRNGWGDFKKATVVGMVNDEPGYYWILLEEEDRRQKVKLTELYPWSDELVAAMKIRDEKKREAQALIKAAEDEYNVKSKPKASECEPLREKISGMRVIEE
jgi:hypothetical protein